MHAHVLDINLGCFYGVSLHETRIEIHVMLLQNSQRNLWFLLTLRGKSSPTAYFS